MPQAFDFLLRMRWEMKTLSEKEKVRYSRQILMKEVGEKGQKKLKKAHVVVAGMGGLGSCASLYLAAAGIGRLTLVDFDTVELSNLNRQILHWEKDIGKNKVESAAAKLREINGDITITGIHAKISEKNILRILEDADAVVDALDNFKTRFILNRAVVKCKIPLFHGACHGFQGRMTTIMPGKTPCLRCLFPKSPPEEKVPVIGVTPGVIGAIQATEAIKYFIGLPGLFVNQLFLYDAACFRYEIIKVVKDPYCRVCRKCVI
jgi:adenylyltransferase/sulfurtransferase